jgi:hypothetical protein
VIITEILDGKQYSAIGNQQNPLCLLLPEKSAPLDYSFRADSPARIFAWEPNLVPANEAFAPFLTGSDSQTEFDVTPTKQTAGEFLTGSRTHIKDSAAQHVFAPKTDVHTVMDRAAFAQFASRMLPRDGGGKLLRP